MVVNTDLLLDTIHPECHSCPLARVRGHFVLFVTVFRLKQPFPELLQIKHASNQDFSEKLHFEKQSYMSASKKLKLDQNSTAFLGEKPQAACAFPS